MLDIFHELWQEIHVTSLRINNIYQYKDFCKWIRHLANNFPCARCKGHLISYIDLNPPEHEKDLFRWGWELHNNVNKRLNKEYISYEKAKKLWSEYL